MAKVQRVFYSNCLDGIREQLFEINKLIKSERLDKAELTLENPGQAGYSKYIKPVLDPYCRKFHRKVQNKGQMFKAKLWEIYDKFSMGGFIRRNYSFGRDELDIYGSDIRGVDRHCAYQYYLGQSCLHPEPLTADQCDFEHKKYVEWAVYGFEFKMKPQYKDVALFGNPKCKYVDYLIEGKMKVGMPTQYWDFIQQFADFKLIFKRDVYYFEDLDNILESSMKQFYKDRETLTGDAKLACKAMGCAAVGYMALKPKDGGKVIPLINPIADYWVCARCQMGTLSMIKRVIDNDGMWIQSITDSCYWKGGPKYEELDLKNEYGSWDIAIKGEPQHFRSVTSGHYGISDKDGNLLVAKFSGFGDDSIWCKAIKHYMKSQPLEKWHTMRTLKNLGDKLVQYLIREAELNECDLDNQFDKMKDIVDQGGRPFLSDNKGLIANEIASYKTNMQTEILTMPITDEKGGANE